MRGRGGGKYQAPCFFETRHFCVVVVGVDDQLPAPCTRGDVLLVGGSGVIMPGTEVASGEGQ